MRVLAAGVLVSLALPAGAAATDYGGGTAPDSVRRANRQLTLVGIRTAGDGSGRIAVKVAAGCGLAKATRAVQPAADGTFRLEFTSRNRVPGEPGLRQRSRFTVTGRIVGAVAGGTVRARLTFRRGGRTVERCDSGDRAWAARAAAAEPTAAAPQPGAAYHGLTSQSGRPFPFVLRVDPGATRVRVAAFDYRQRCDDGGFEWENITPGARIAADDSFRLRERFGYTWADGRERYRVKVDGRFTTTGVSGTLSVSSVLRSPGGRVIDRCATGRQTFAAVL
jgi:hypothetical protein